MIKWPAAQIRNARRQTWRRKGPVAPPHGVIAPITGGGPGGPKCQRAYDPRASLLRRVRPRLFGEASSVCRTTLPWGPPQPWWGVGIYTGVVIDPRRAPGKLPAGRTGIFLSGILAQTYHAREA